MKILFINPAWGERKAKGLKGLHSNTPPLGLLYIAAYIRENGFSEVAVLDETIGQKAIEGIYGFQPDIVAVTATTPQFTRAIEIIKDIKSKRPHIKVALGGHHATTLSMLTMNKYLEIDFLISGEGEETFLELLSAIKGNTNFEKVNGLVFRNGENIIQNKNRSYFNNLDSLPWPARDLIDIKAYKLAPLNYRRLPATTMITSRGCPFRCLYCNKRVFGDNYRSNSAQRVLKEMLHIVNTYRIREIKLWDDVFTLHEKRTKEICEGLKDLKLDLSLSCESRVDVVTPELLTLMKSAGFWQINYGLESGNQTILDVIHKDITIEKMRQAISWTKDAGISARAYFIIGLPGETAETIKETVKLSLELDIDSVVYFVAIPYPGTKLYEIIAKETNLPQDWNMYSHVDIDNPVYVPKGMDKRQLKMFWRRAYRKFYLRPKYILKRLRHIWGWENIKINIRALAALLNGQ